MADKKSVGHAYNIDFLNVVFAASSVFLFVAVIWMVWDDFDREWKNTQRRFVQLETEVTQANLEKATRGVDQKKMADLEAKLAAAEKAVGGNQEKIDELRSQLRAIDARLARESQDYQFTKATYDQDKYDFEASRSAGASNAARKGEAVAALEKRMNELLLQVQKTEAERAALQRQIAQLNGEVGTIQAQMTEMHLDE